MIRLLFRYAMMKLVLGLVVLGGGYLLLQPIFVGGLEKISAAMQSVKKDHQGHGRGKDGEKAAGKSDQASEEAGPEETSDSQETSGGAENPAQD